VDECLEPGGNTGVCYQAYASVHFDYRGFEQQHKAVDPWEGAILKVIAGLLMVRCDRAAVKHEEIGGLFHE
jgi:hypothetical protein